LIDLAVLSSSSSSSLDSRFLELASFLGVNVNLIEAHPALSVDDLDKQLGPRVRGIAICASTLAASKALFASAEVFVAWLGRQGRRVLLYGFEATAEHNALIRWLTGGAVRGMISLSNGFRCSFPTSGTAFTQQLSGASFSREPRPSDCGFEIDPQNRSLTVLTKIGDEASFVHAEVPGGDIFLWAAKSIPSLQERVSPDTGLAPFYDELLPAIIFVRRACSVACWENPIPTARVIIDDPLLADRYGFLDYKQLFHSMEKLNYALTIAFIPWNYRRTKAQAANSFLPHTDRLSICVHGCDHINNEFGIADRVILEHKAALAVERMRQHQQRTNLPFEKVMVFPQGRFSTAAIQALRRSDYLAAVNTSRTPTDSANERPTIGDELLPATNCFSGFPVFHRRYPRDVAHFAVDLYLGKPAYVVEHHEVFEHGCEAIESCVQALKKMDPRLSWPGLSALERIYLRKQDAWGSLQVRFFSSTFSFENSTQDNLVRCFSKPEPDPGIVKRVRSNGRSIEFRTGERFVEFQSELKPGELVRIQLEDCEQPPKQMFSLGPGYALKTSVRRHLSEFRDNYLAKHPSLLKPAKRLVRLLKASGDSKRETLPVQSQR